MEEEAGLALGNVHGVQGLRQGGAPVLALL
jgi:hypothetical protein